MADKKVFKIEIDGVEKSYNDVIKLSEALNAINSVNATVATSNEQVAASNNTVTQSQQEVSKAQQEYERIQQRIQALESESTRINIEANQQLRDRRAEVTATVQANTAQEGSVRQMAAQLKLLRAQYDNLSKAERENADVGGALLAQIQELDAAHKAAKEATGRHQESVGDYTIAGKAMKQELGEIEEKLAAMILAGEGNSEMFQELVQRAGEIKQSISDAGASIDEFASHSQGLNDVISVGETLTATFGTATGVMNMFGVANEDVEKSIQKMMGVMTTLQSLQTLQNTLTTKGTLVNTLYTKALTALGIIKKSNTTATVAETAAETANTASTTANTAAQGANATATIAQTVATKAATIATTLWNAVLAANPLVLIAMALAGVVAAIIAFSDETDNATVSTRNLNYALNETKYILSELEYQLNFQTRLMAAQGKNQRDILQYTIDKRKEEVDLAKKGYEDMKSAFSKMNAEEREANKQALQDSKDIYQSQEKAYQDSLDNMVIYDAQQKTDAKKKREQDGKQAGQQYKQNLENYKKTLKSYLEESNKMWLLNENTRISNLKDSANNMTAVTKDELKVRNQAIKDAYNQELTYASTLAENEQKVLKEKYDALIVQAEKLGQDTTAITEEYNKQKDELDTKSFNNQKKILNDRNKAVKKSNDDYLKSETDRINKLRDEQNKAIDNETKQIEYQLNTINNLKENAVARSGKFNLIDVDATKNNLKEVGNELNKYLKTLDSSKKQIERYYDALISTYDKDSQEHKDAVENKKQALNDLDNKIKTTNKDIADNTQAATQVINDYWDDLSTKIGEKVQVISDSVGSVFETMSMFFDMQLEEANAKLDEVTEKYEAAVELQEESNERLKALNEEAKTAQGGRALVVQDEIQREMALNKELANQEKQLAKEKEKREKEAAKIERQQKKTEMMGNIVQGTANTALAVINALTVSPFPLGLALASVAGAMGAAQVGIMSAQLSKLEKGGLINGKPHSQGGARIEGTNIEVEGNEYVVNKRTTMKNVGLLSYINSQDRELGVGDFINYYDDNTGKIVPTSGFKQMYEDGGQLVNLNNIASTNNSNEEILSAIKNINFNPTVSVTDINRVNDQMATVRDSAGFS
ncbi:hypothetical protein [Dysgonomonas sp. 520]|uniref:hypothetical protein n=1 Tax=Dysgonomonas sp. 520 TaxID=2302931 RepID=UPI0013D55B7F|nr:hypothetical protein [Dysgonomonas sp. 520]